jgi:eukaryotic-like serine/threonine-protein kinase
MPDDAGSSSGAGLAATLDAALGVEPGSVIGGKYRIDRLLGKGGMGVVVAATQLALDRTVAIKLVRSDCVQDPQAVERLLREAKAVASISSEHVARVLDVGTLDSGAPFIVMEYLEGSDLQTLLQNAGPLPAVDAVDFVLQACEALAEAHRNGIVHRDIKPANIFVARLPGGSACVKVVDFGISKMIGLGSLEPLTLPTSVVGSLFHMAPEQMRGAPVDARTDVWALGLLLFEMLTGRKPFQADAWPAVCAQVLSDGTPFLSAPVEGVDAELAAVIERCVRRSPSERYGNVAELAVMLAPFGSRNARMSLERIVRLATSTGSLSADSLSASLGRAGQTPSAIAAALDSTRPWSGREPGATRQTHELSWPGRLSTPAPVATPRSSKRAPRSRGWMGLGFTVVVFSIGAALFLLRPEAMKDSDPAPPARPGSLESISAVSRTPAAASSVDRTELPPLQDSAPNGTGGAAAGGAGGASAREANAATTPPAPTAAARQARTGAAANSATQPSQRATAKTSGEPAAKPPAAAGTAARASDIPEGRRRPPKNAPKTPDPWDLRDIDFTEGRRP